MLKGRAKETLRTLWVLANPWASQKSMTFKVPNFAQIRPMASLACWRLHFSMILISIEGKGDFSFPHFRHQLMFLQGLLSARQLFGGTWQQLFCRVQNLWKRMLRWLCNHNIKERKMLKGKETLFNCHMRWNVSENLRRVNNRSLPDNKWPVFPYFG